MLIPWINDNKSGFFEYSLQYRTIHTVARTIEELQTIFTKDVFNYNTHQIDIYLNKIFEEDYSNKTIEEQSEIEFSEYQQKFFEENKEVAIEKLMSDDILIPWDITIEEVGYNMHEYTETDLTKLAGIIKNCPNSSQSQLEEIFSDKKELKSVNNEYVEYVKEQSVSESFLDMYDNNLNTSDMLCSMYEKIEQLQSQLVSSAELIVEMYEQNNTV